MASILNALNCEWSTLATSPDARQALMRWTAIHPVLGEASDLHGVLALGYYADTGPEVRRILARLATRDEFAARTLLQALLGGLANLAQRIGYDDDALDELIAMAWERIRTYPVHRAGSVAGNVILDVRKRYLRHHAPDVMPDGATVGSEMTEPSAEDLVVAAAFLDDLVTVSQRHGVPDGVLATIIRSRVGGESMADLAAEQHVTRKVLWHRRWRAEARLRQIPLAS
jgi:hypothetical protein